MPRKRRRKTESLEVVNRDCAGVDIGKDVHYVAVDPEPIKFTHLTPGRFRVIRPVMQIGMRQVPSETIEWFRTACKGSTPVRGRVGERRALR